MNNRRVLNATPVIVDGIEMKSKIEKTIYLALKNMGILALYEAETFTYWKGGRPKALFYDLSSDRKNRLNMKKLIDMKYTPDFVFMYGEIKVIIEVKGWENDNFSIKKKMFRMYLDTLPYPVVYAEIFTKKQLLEFMGELQKEAPEIIKQKRRMLVRRKRNDCTAIFFTGENWQEVLNMFNLTSPADEEKAKKYLDEYDALLVSDRLLGQFEIWKNHWVVRDNTTGLAFQMTEAEFNARYDIIRDGE